jgi:type IV secretory pathway VirB2 component (pilin)
MGENEENIEECDKFSIRQYILFKLDRNIAIVGLIAIGLAALFKGATWDEKVVSGVVGALAVYLGARGSNTNK